jgi:hypothetical protein
MSHAQYITNKKGKKQFVVLPVKEYKKMLEEIEILIKMSSTEDVKQPKEKEAEIKKVEPIKKEVSVKKTAVPKKVTVAKKIVKKVAVPAKKK